MRWSFHKIDVLDMNNDGKKILTIDFSKEKFEELKEIYQTPQFLVVDYFKRYNM